MPQRYLIAVMLAILWVVPFLFKATDSREKPLTKDRSARAGVIIQGISFSVMWSAPAYYVPDWRIALGMLLGLLGIALSQSALRHLGPQWRLDAALNADHRLIRTGPYSVVRHPIYTGMFAVVLGIGLLLSQWPVFVAGVVLYVIGTEIRIRSEERLLRSRFGEIFDIWARRVWAYIPFLR